MPNRTSSLRVTIGQINPIVGDLAGNSKKMLIDCQKAHNDGANVIIFPELSLIGYPPLDKLLDASFLSKIKVAQQDFINETAKFHNLFIIFGTIGNVPEIISMSKSSMGLKCPSLYNTAIVAQNGKIVERYNKRHLPNTGVFTEKRYFDRGSKDVPSFVVPTENGDVRCGVFICEDIWRKGYDKFKDKFDVVFSPNASPFEEFKMEEREQVVNNFRRQLNGVAVVYCNQVGAQDDVIFDGGSFVVHADGSRESCVEFEEDVRTFDVLHQPKTVIDVEALAHDLGEQLRLKRMWQACVLGIRDYVKKNGFQSVVLGVSGGIDSAVVTTMAVDALGPEAVTGILMPSQYSSSHSISDAEELANNLGIKTYVVPIKDLYDAFQNQFKDTGIGEMSGIADQNLQARLRGTVLIQFSNQQAEIPKEQGGGGCLVLATGNKSELAVGYATYLDAGSIGACSPIGDVYKTDVYKLANWRNIQNAVIPENTITKPASAELAPGQVDSDTLPEYDVLDPILKGIIEGYNNDYLTIDADEEHQKVKARVQRMIQIAQWKRQQYPLSFKVTRRSFGRDWQFPITAR
jgi:NAD+ synthase (glutamine-hydrolysing)